MGHLTRRSFFATAFAPLIARFMPKPRRVIQWYKYTIPPWTAVQCQASLDGQNWFNLSPETSGTFPHFRVVKHKPFTGEIRMYADFIVEGGNRG